MKIDKNGNIFILYSDKLGYNNDNLKLATNYTGEWKIFKLYSRQEVENTSLFLEDNGTIDALFQPVSAGLLFKQAGMGISRVEVGRAR